MIGVHTVYLVVYNVDSQINESLAQNNGKLVVKGVKTTNVPTYCTYCAPGCIEYGY